MHARAAQPTGDDYLYRAIIVKEVDDLLAKECISVRSGGHVEKVAGDHNSSRGRTTRTPSGDVRESR